MYFSDGVGWRPFRLLFFWVAGFTLGSGIAFATRFARYRFPVTCPTDFLASVFFCWGALLFSPSALQEVKWGFDVCTSTIGPMVPGTPVTWAVAKAKPFVGCKLSWGTFWSIETRLEGLDKPISCRLWKIERMLQGFAKLRWGTNCRFWLMLQGLGTVVSPSPKLNYLSSVSCEESVSKSTFWFNDSTLWCLMAPPNWVKQILEGLLLA